MPPRSLTATGRLARKSRAVFAFKMDAIELPDDQKLLDAVLSPANLEVAQERLEAAVELTEDIVLFIQPQSLPETVRTGVCELACSPSRQGSFKLLSPNEDINVARMSEYQGAWLVSYEQDETLAEGQFSIDPVVANDMGTSEDLRHGRLDILVRFKRPCEAFRALGHILAATRYAVTLASAPSMRGDEPYSPPVSDDEPMSAGSSASSSNSRSRTLGKILNFLSREETANFESLGALLDVSRNGVFTVDSVKFFLRQQALVGCNLLHLYTEFVTFLSLVATCHQNISVYAPECCGGGDAWGTQAQASLSLRLLLGKLMPFSLSLSSATFEALTLNRSSARSTIMPSTSA